MADPIDSPQAGGRAAGSVRFEVSGNDPASAARDLATVHGADQWSAQRGEDGFAYRYTALGDTDVSIRRSQMRGVLRGGMPIGSHYIVAWMTSGRAHLDVAGERVDLRRNVPTLLPCDAEFVFAAEDHDQRLVHFDRGLVHGFAADQLDLGDRPLRFDHAREPDTAAFGRWQSVLTTLSRALRLGGPGSDAWLEAKSLAVAAFLDTFPPRIDGLPAALGLPRNARLRTAVEYVHAHASKPITITDLAAVTGLSVRSVQEAFRRVFDESPLTYLRDVRLDRVRGELLEADPQAGIIGDVARRWGFAHLGRFSATYAARFGEYPKQTLRR
ncbi:helix-turn-helix transcriptional regulator [Curtobacterium sp. VKM Ac-1393]|uniref:helix-turn-helix transcriptional regulator n=1 Tax=Curtobacterium sp. VKM Ac-1393 TaxID=2783814 RepID=UPI00188AD90A|nr:AraC family transcriptional regulator [Curtobacterium sp. VKM Ac-1393]MBF4608989.1 AraC family transcriptional regulator [Curtobacterium sp. VKM Ac-1393]